MSAATTENMIRGVDSGVRMCGHAVTTSRGSGASVFFSVEGGVVSAMACLDQAALALAFSAFLRSSVLMNRMCWAMGRREGQT